jgi:hypothetical protein
MAFYASLEEADSQFHFSQCNADLSITCVPDLGEKGKNFLFLLNNSTI